MTGRRAYAVALASGVALSFAFPEPSLSPLAWIALAPLLVGLARPGGVSRGALLGACFGIGFFGTLLVWVSVVGWVAWIVLVVVETAFVAVFAAATAWFLRSGTSVAYRVLVPAVLWVAVAEHLRSLVPVGGFSWGQLAQSQHDLGWMLKTASLGGGWLVALLIVVVNGLLAEALQRRSAGPRTAGFLLVIGIVLLAAPAALPSNDATGDTIRVALVQGNVPRDFPGTSYEKEVTITRSHRELTEDLAGRGIDVVFWPESSVGVDITGDPVVASEVGAAARAVDAPLIVGANLDVDEDHYQVTALHVEPDGTIADVYVKTHLVPFGEYVPMRSLFGRLPILDQVPRDAVAEDEVGLFEIQDELIAPVLSYEGDFGALVRRRMDDGGRMLVVATNTSTWGESWASAQHLAFSQVRAAETGVWVVHAAISGISGLVAPDGAVQASLPLWEEGTIVRDIRFAEDTTFYARVGEWVPALCYLIIAGLVARGALRWRRRGGDASTSPVAED